LKEEKMNYENQEDMRIFNEESMRIIEEEICKKVEELLNNHEVKLEMQSIIEEGSQNLINGVTLQLQ
jgi:hypothetical protein